MEAWSDKTVRLWDIPTRQAVATLEGGHVGSIHSVALSHDGKTLAAGCQWNAVTVWDLATRRMRFYLQQDRASLVAGGEIAVWSVVFSPDDKTLAAGTSTGTVRLWDPATGQLLASLKGHTDAVHAVSFSPDGKTVATGSADRTTKLWDVAAAQERTTLKGHTNVVRAVAFATDGQMLVTGSADGTLRLWRATKDQEASEPKAELDHDDPDSPVTQIDRADQLQTSGRRGEAEDLYRQALSRLEKLSAAFPSSTGHRRIIGRNRLNLALMNARPEELEKAVAAFTKLDEIGLDLILAMNDQAWLLATCPDPKLRSCALSLRLAQKAVESLPKEGSCWNTLGVAQYRNGDWQGAIDALMKSEALAPGQNLAFNAFFLAMAHWKLDHKEDARKWYNEAVRWMEKNQPKNEELVRFRAEVAALLEVNEKKD
jgi:hypothetical protein